jgi:hypothetical protein
MAMLGEDDGDIPLPTRLDHLQDILQNGLDDPMKIVLYIDDEQHSMLRVDLGLSLPIRF